MDAQPGLQHNMRITVRQLESLIRLSEAVARLHFSDFVREEHVQEAVEIFRASLHRLTHTEDIHLTVSGAPSEKRADGLGPHAAEGDQQQQQQQQEEGISVSHAEYRRIALQLVDFVSQQENAAADGPQPFQGVNSTAVIEWWIEEILQPDDPEQLDPWHRKLRLIIQRLVDQDGYLLGQPAPEGGPEGELLLRVHPNVADLSSLGLGGVSAFGYRSFGFRGDEQEGPAAAAEDEAAEAAAAGEDAEDADLTTEEFERIQEMLQRQQAQEEDME
ncbi:hypothetical protein Efla_002593 [Eimeria flavescens]